MRKRNLLGAAAFSLALAGGGVAGALLGTPGTSGAQDGGTATTEQPTPADGARPERGPGRPGHPGHPGHPGIEAAAEALGITPEELRTELEAGTSIAQVASDRGVDQQVVIDAIVREGTERLNEQLAKLPERAAELVAREGLPQRPKGGPEGRPEPHGEDAPADAEGSSTTSS